MNPSTLEPLNPRTFECLRRAGVRHREALRNRDGAAPADGGFGASTNTEFCERLPDQARVSWAPLGRAEHAIAHLFECRSRGREVHAIDVVVVEFFDSLFDSRK